LGEASDLDFERVVKEYYRLLYRFALTLSRSEAEACDLTQETFHIWARKSGQLRDPAKLKTWLCTTLYREFLKGKRRAARIEPLDAPEEEFAGEDFAEGESGPVSGLDHETVLAALRGLDERFRAPLALYYLEDHSYQEIAGILEVPIGTVMSRLNRGKLQLKAALTGQLREAAWPGGGAKALP